MRGYTLVELIVVILLITILTAVAAPRFFAPDDFEGPAFAQDLAAAARYAQKLAIASNCSVRLTVTAGGYDLRQPTTECDLSTFPGVGNVTHPGSGNPFTASAPSGVTIAGAATVTFSAAGIPSAAPSFTVAGRTVSIAAGSGYVELQ